jgi:hypothetical protein
MIEIFTIIGFFFGVINLYLGLAKKKMIIRGGNLNNPKHFAFWIVFYILFTIIMLILSLIYLGFFQIFEKTGPVGI